MMIQSEQIKEHGLKELKSNIVVQHLTSATLNRLPGNTREAYTKGCVKKFNRDYNKNVLGIGV